MVRLEQQDSYFGKIDVCQNKSITSSATRTQSYVPRINWVIAAYFSGFSLSSADVADLNNFAFAH